MKKAFVTFTVVCGIIILAAMSSPIMSNESIRGDKSMDTIKLPEPDYDSKISIEKALLERRSVRGYTKES